MQNNYVFSQRHTSKPGNMCLVQFNKQAEVFYWVLNHDATLSGLIDLVKINLQVY